MEFPAYVPAALRSYYKSMIEGNESKGAPGYVETLRKAEDRVRNVEQNLDRNNSMGDMEMVLSTRKNLALAVERRDMIANDVECLHRFINDIRMKDVYGKLTLIFEEDRQWENYIHAAWAARQDYSRYRDRLKQALELKNKIGVAATKLADLLKQVDEVGYSDWPPEFFSIPALLMNTDNHQNGDHNLDMWQGLSSFILGDSPLERDNEPVAEGEHEPPHKVEIREVYVGKNQKVDLDPVEEFRNSLRYAWDTAPPLSSLLETVSDVADNFTPSESGMVAAAIDSRKPSSRTEYIRAFASLLRDRHGFVISADIIQAMAITANVVNNLPNEDMSFNDVRGALSKPQ